MREKIEVDIGSWDGWDETDFGGGVDYKIPKPRHTFNKVMYDQTKVNSHSCPLVASATSYTSNIGIELSLEELKNIWKAGENDKIWVSGVGGNIKAAVNYLTKWHNRKGGLQIMYMREEFDSPKFWEWMQLGYDPVVGGRFNSTFYNDVLADGVLDDANIGMPTFGHFVTDTLRGAHVLVDNYNYRKYNQYQLTLAQARQLRSEGKIFASAYFFCFKDDFDKVNGPDFVMPVWADRAVKYVQDNKLIEKGWDNPDQEVSKETIEWSLKKAGIISEVTGKMPLYRWATILYKILNQ